MSETVKRRVPANLVVLGVESLRRRGCGVCRCCRLPKNPSQEEAPSSKTWDDKDKSASQKLGICEGVCFSLVCEEREKSMYLSQT